MSLDDVFLYSSIVTAEEAAKKLPRKAPGAQFIKRQARKYKYFKPGAGAPKVETVLAAVERSQKLYDERQKRSSQKPARSR